MSVARSTRKSVGRFWRSVAMMTHRPVIGSLRSSGIERVLKHLHHRLAGLDLDRDDVEPARLIRQMMAGQVVAGKSRDPPPLGRRHRLPRLPKHTPLPRLHFHKHHRPAVATDDVDFSHATTIPFGKNCVPATFQLTTSEIFACFSKSDSFLRHARTASKRRATTEVTARRRLLSALRRISEPRYPPARASAPAAVRTGRRSSPRRGPAVRAGTRR